MRSLLEILAPLKGSSVAFAVNHSILASVVMGYWHSQQARPSTGQLQLRHCGSRVFHKMGWGEACHNITSATIKKFFWQNIICRYGVPQQITIDNAKYFDSDMFKDFFHQVGTKVAFTSVYHPQSNGVVERANALIFKAIKKIIEGEKKASGPK
jgi:hypothetical protein